MQLIVDGQHVADDVVRLVFAAARGRVALVTDAIAAAGQGDGRYRLGGVEVEVRDGVARGAGGMLAGSTVTMIESVRRVHELGVPLPEAVAAATSTPARIAGQPLGSLAPGATADVGRPRRPPRDPACCAWRSRSLGLRKQAPCARERERSRVVAAGNGPYAVGRLRLRPAGICAALATLEHVDRRR